MLAVVAACGSGSTSVGDQRTDAAADAGLAVQSDAGHAATFTQIYAALFPELTNARCNFCHSMRASDTSNGKLSVGTTQAAAYVALVGPSSSSTECSGMPLVVPGDPEASLLLLKLIEPPPCGSRMPLGGAALSEAQLEQVRSWIAAGAKND
ncbi:MAG: hypothetical protein JWN04_3896 [Myxococcaceae bacterium]|nr:hypothetical protein [Myxococcaceae bacterium]